MRVWHWVCRVSLALGTIGLPAGLPAMPASKAMAAEWLAPAAQAQINADWVQDVAKAIRTNRFKNVFANQSSGCDQCRILEYLNHAAESLESDEPKLAESFVRRAISVLDNGVEEGWYDEVDVRTIKRLIVKKAKEGFEEAGAPAPAISVPKKQGQDPRYKWGREPMFSRSDEPDGEYGSRRDRWPGYTSNRRLGLTNELPHRNGPDQSGLSSNQYSQSQSNDPFSGQYLDEVQKMSRSGNEANPFTGAYGDLVERWGKKASPAPMSR